jgi:sugar phosphate isomerase/epimerase
MKPAFSTVACPNWTLDEVASQAEHLGFMGVELRTFGSASKEFACDPALTDSAKVRSMFDKVGVDIACLATSIRYDEPVADPMLHILGDNDKTTLETKSAIALASQIECPLVRVFAYEKFGSEPTSRAVRRITDRLKLAAAAARNTGVRLVLENGGSFSTAAQVAEILDAVGSPSLGAAYSVGTAWCAGEKPEHGINVLRDHLACVKLSDWKGNHPCALGRGEVSNAAAVGALGAAGYTGWITFEYPKAWVHSDAVAETVLMESAKTMFAWMGNSRSERPARARAGTGQA